MKIKKFPFWEAVKEIDSLKERANRIEERFIMNAREKGAEWFLRKQLEELQEVHQMIAEQLASMIYMNPNHFEEVEPDEDYGFEDVPYFANKRG